MNIIEYLNENNILVGTEYFKNQNILNENIDMYKQIQLIGDIQQIFTKKRPNILPPIGSTIGKEFEGYKVKIKKIKRYLDELKIKDKNDFNCYLIDILQKTINRAENTIGAIDNCKYIELIKRSMKNNEICLGKVDEGNIKRNGEFIQIRTTKYLSCNLVEHDCYNYIRRLKKRECAFDIQEIIMFFTNIQGLDEYSKEYIYILSNYPIETVRAFIKIKNEYDTLNNEEWINILQTAISIDGNELL